VRRLWALSALIAASADSSMATPKGYRRDVEVLLGRPSEQQRQDDLAEQHCLQVRLRLGRAGQESTSVTPASVMT
jgi:hypothetical protein